MLVAAGGVEEVIKAFRAFPENAKVVEQGCLVIRNVTNGRDDMKDKLVAAGVIDEVIKALRAFPAKSEIIKHGSVAIYFLADGSKDRKDKLVAAGVKPLLEAALNNKTLTQEARDQAKDVLGELV